MAEEIEYNIIGSNNFWYASCLKSMKEVNDEIKNIKAGRRNKGTPYGDPESGHHPDLPETLYVYKGVEIMRVELDEEDED